MAWEEIETKTLEKTLHVSSSIKEFRHPEISIEESYIVQGQRALIAQNNIPAYTILFTYSGPVSFSRTRTSIQIEDDKHLEAGNFGSYTNHSCNPNAIIKTVFEEETNNGKVALISRKNISKGEEITFDYATSETELTPALNKKPCLCRSEKCRGTFKSFFDLSDDEKQKLFNQGLLADHIQKYMR